MVSYIEIEHVKLVLLVVLILVVVEENNVNYDTTVISEVVMQS